MSKNDSPLLGQNAVNGADMLCDTLLAHDIDVCFANPGTSEMHFVAALDRKPQMRCVLGLFEGVVTGAADGYARMADKPAATLLHLGSGLGNGIANLHNAKRAFTPMVNIVGDHATYHLQYDAPLTSDIAGLARPVSAWVHTTQTADAVSTDAAEAVAQAWGAPSGIATLILPADAAWNAVTSTQVSVRPRPVPEKVSDEAIKAVADALRNGKTSVLFLTGMALREASLELVSRISQATGARFMAQQSNGRMQRGAGRVAIERIRYRPDDAREDLAGVQQLILVGAKEPVAFFAYPGKASTYMEAGSEVMTLASNADDLLDALTRLAQMLEIPDSVLPILNERVVPELPKGPLDIDKVAVIVGAMMPENAIIIDEAISSARDFFRVTHSSAPHDFLQLTGGAIGIGLPLAAGAAIACPDRKVIGLQADGSGMYTMQALWTHAREKLDIVTIIYANQRYNILHQELKNVGAGAPGRNARAMLDIVEPTLDWVALAKGVGVDAALATTAEEFAALLEKALQTKGPFLIEARV